MQVRFFAVKKGGHPKAYFYLDPYSRPAEKRGGAWCAHARFPQPVCSVLCLLAAAHVLPAALALVSCMLLSRRCRMDEVAGQSRLFAAEGQDVRLPVAHMVCNQSPPVAGKPSLMTFREVETLFHEFGHAAQHMLTEQREGLCAGIRGVEWDAVELPSQVRRLLNASHVVEPIEPLHNGFIAGVEDWTSGFKPHACPGACRAPPAVQFMENWCYDRATLYSFAKHYETGEPLPEELYQRLLAARTFRRVHPLPGGRGTLVYIKAMCRLHRLCLATYRVFPTAGLAV